MLSAEKRPVNVSLVLTAIGPDRPGLVGLLSNTIAAHGGNWLESRMAHMSGKFAGILRLSVPLEQADALTLALTGLAESGLKVTVEASEADAAEPRRRILKLELVGHDHPGIVRELSHALSAKGINVEELLTEVQSAAMSGEMLFRADARLRLPETMEVAELRQTLEDVADVLTVEISLED